MTTEKFCLRWNDFESNINEAFRELREANDFLDITLVCENEQIQAHKVILSACSSFFRSMLRRNVHQHPLIYLKGIKFSDLQSVLNFMYQGEVSVAQEDLNSFLSVAEDLRVKGLTQNQTEKPESGKDVMTQQKPREENYHKPGTAIEKEPRVIEGSKKSARYNNPAKHDNTFTGDYEEIEEVLPVKTEPEDSPILPPAPQQDMFIPDHGSHALTTTDYMEEEYQDYEQYQHSMQDSQTKGCSFQDPSDLLQFVRKDPYDQKFHCTLCDRFSHSVITCTRNHVESKHYPDSFTYQCDLCEQIFNSKMQLNNHKQTKHKKIKSRMN